MRRSLVAGSLVALVATIAAPAPRALASSVPVGMVDPDNIHVESFEGWGTALAWGANVVGGWSDSKRTAIADLLFSPTSGLGLNVVRYHIGGGLNPNWQSLGCGEHRPGSPLPTYSTAPGVYDWTADANQRWFAQAAKARGADRWLAYASSPPYWMTINGCTNGGNDDGSQTVGHWGHDGDGTGAYNGTTSYSEWTNDSVTVRFNGTQISFYAAKSSDSGHAAISVDGGAETVVDLYAPARQGNQLVYTSAVLPAGTHTLKVRVTGKENPATSDQFVSVDRVVISPGATSIDDQVRGTGLNQFNYRREHAGPNLKGYWGHDGDGTGAHNGTTSYSNHTDDSVTFRFTGTQISFHASKSNDSGRAAISVDGGAETTVDLYAPTGTGNELVYTSAVLPAGTHTLKVRVTGTKSASSSGYFVSPDRVVVSPGGASIDDQVRGTGINQFDYHWNMYEPFADYLTEVTEHVRDSWGITFDLLDPLNEPENPWIKYGNQEGALFGQRSQDELITRVGQSLAAKGLTGTTIAAPDSWVPGAKSFFDNYSAAAKSHISTLTTHTYFGTVDDQVALRMAARDWGKRLWMSEFGSGEVLLGQPTLYADPTKVQPAINLASQIVTDLSYLRPTAWIQWDGIESWEMNEQENTSWGLIWGRYNDPGQTYTVAKQYYGYGNFTRFIRPGYQIIEPGDDQTLAAYDPVGGRLVLVAYNDSDSSRAVTYDLGKFDGISSATPYRTSDTESLAQKANVAVTNNRLPVTLPAKSITTFVMSSAAARWGLTSINDQDVGGGRNQIAYTGAWSSGPQTGAYLGDNRWSGTTNASYEVRFNGNRVHLYGAKAPNHGIAAVSIDGGAETLVDFYASGRLDNVRVYTSPSLALGDHTLRVRVTGTRNASSSGPYIPADRVDVAQPGATEVNDSEWGTGTNRFEYIGSWAHGAQAGAYGNDGHWSGTANASYRVRFNGSKIDLYGSRAPNNGIAAVSIDGGPETNVDLYSASRQDDVLVWSSPVHAGGAHTLSVRVTGTRNNSSTGAYVPADRVDVFPSAAENIVARHSGKCLSVSDWSIADGAAVIQWTCGSGTNQQWTANDLGNGYYQLFARHSGKCLNVSGASTADGASVIQYTCGRHPNEQWSIQDLGGGYHRFVARHSGKCLSVSDWSTADGASVIQWTCGGGTNQQWSRVGVAP